MAAFSSMAMDIDPLIFAMQQTGFFQNAQHKDKQFAVYLQRQMPPDAAQGGVIGHGFTGGKAQESPQGQGIASCTGRCRAQSRCPRNSRSRACGKNSPAGWTCGRVCRRRMERTAFWGRRQMHPHAGAFAAAGTRPAPHSAAVDRKKTTCSSALPASGQGS